MTKHRNIKIVLICTVGLAIIAISSWLILDNKPQADPSTAPVFQFDQSKAAGWFSGGNYNSQANVNLDEYDETVNRPVDELPIADIVVHHNGPGSSTQHDDSCFASFSYYDYPLASIDNAYQKHEERIDEWGEVNLIGASEQTILTPEGEKAYELRSYRSELDGGGDDYMKGNQIGYLALANGHIQIKGVCQTSEDLALLKPILASVQLVNPSPKVHP